MTFRYHPQSGTAGHGLLYSDSPCVRINAQSLWLEMWFILTWRKALLMQVYLLYSMLQWSEWYWAFWINERGTLLLGLRIQNRPGHVQWSCQWGVSKCLLQSIGEIDRFHKNINDLKLAAANSEDANVISNQIALSIVEINDVFSRLPTLEYFKPIALGCDSTSFFETTTISTKNMSLSFQRSYYKIRKSKKALSLKDYMSSRGISIANSELEAALNNDIESDLRDELKLLKSLNC